MKNKKIFLITIILIISIFFILLLGLKKEQNYIPESKLSIIKNNISFKTLYSEEKIFLNDHRSKYISKRIKFIFATT